jgi:hypothetical protein
MLHAPVQDKIASVQVWYENILQHLRHWALEPYHAHFWSWLNDHTHSDATEIVELFSIVVTGVVIVPKGMPITCCIETCFFYESDQVCKGTFCKTFEC